MPFKEWGENKSLLWYQAYNETKHDRHLLFELASFNILLDAMCGLFVILSSQFYTHDFLPGNSYMLFENSNAGIGDYFIIEFPTDWEDDEKYSFSLNDWNLMKVKSNPFSKHGY